MGAAQRPVVTKPFDADQLTARIQVAERILGLAHGLRASLRLLTRQTSTKERRSLAARGLDIG
jgi:DNA-binding response OmpR family regulator